MRLSLPLPRASAILLLLLLTGAACPQAAAPADTAAAAQPAALHDVAAKAAAAAAAAAPSPPPASAATAAAQPAAPHEVAAKAAAVASQAATAAPLAGAACHINITGSSQGGISSARMECSGGPVAIGMHPTLLGAFQHSFRGVTFDTECVRPGCLIRFCGNTTVSINNSTISDVTKGAAMDLLAVLCLANSTQTVLRNSSVSNNNATAVVTGGRAWLHVLASQVAANTGNTLPGGVFGTENSTVVIAGGSVIAHNTAVNASGGGVIVLGHAVLVLSGASRVVNNTSIWYAGGGVAVYESGQARIEGKSMVCNNTSTGPGAAGGGIAVGGRGELALVDGSQVCNNTGGFGGGGLAVHANATVTVHNSSISSNVAHGSGGGFVVVDNGFVAVYDSSIRNNTSIEMVGVGLGGGGIGVGDNARVQLFDGTAVVGNKALGLPGGAFTMDRNASLTLSAGVLMSGNTVVANTSSQAVPYGPDGVAIEASKLIIQPGVLGQDGELTKCSRSILLFRRPCGVGEFDGGSGAPCLCCPPVTYNFEPNMTTCQQCPANALCSGDAVSPLADFWHSSPQSVQMHRCPIAGSCKQGGVCAAGHTGNLCGECADGFGNTLPLRCRKCLSPRLQFGMFLLLVWVTVLLVTITVHFTWQDNKTGDRSLRPSDLIKVLVQFLQYLVILGSISVPWPVFQAGMFTAGTVVFGVGSGQALSLDCWLPHYMPSRLPLALQRQLSYFVGAIVVALACVVMMNLLHVCNRVWKARCLKPTTTRRAQLVAPQLHFWSRLRVTLLVTAFFAYPTLVKAALSFFACLRIDVASLQPYPEFSIRNHTAGYWVSDIQQQCFVGWHRPWALGFGLPAVLLLCVGVPVGLFVFLWCSRRKTADAAFCEHYGFLFRNYTDSKPWWEAVWAVQTVLLTAISVFHFTIQAYYALLLMAFVVLASAAAQVVARPYAQPLLHRLHLASTCCLSLIVLLSLGLFSDSVVVDSVTLGRAHTAVGALIIAVACSFVLWCLSMILGLATSGSPLMRRCISGSTAWLRRCTAGTVRCSCVRLPQSQASKDCEAVAPSG